MSNQVQMVQSRGSRGLRLAGAVATALSFPASQIFSNCDFFPAEFSLVATFKIPRLRQKVSQQDRREPGLVLIRSDLLFPALFPEERVHLLRRGERI